MRQFARILAIASLSVLLLTSLSAGAASAAGGSEMALSSIATSTANGGTLLSVQNEPAQWVGVCVIGVPSPCNAPIWWVSWSWPWWAFRPIWEISALTGFTWPWWSGWWWPWPFVSLVIW
ncbi:MAG: hypothetical protein IRZ14_06020 [Chloroflexi bacterium]|nr:hypothetical protein [Chloroflexota bacterium]